MMQKIDWQIPQVIGFVKDKVPRKQILDICQLIEYLYEFNTPLILCFIDYNKAFDCVIWSDLRRVLRRMGVPVYLLSLIETLYLNNQGTVIISKTAAAPFNFKKGCQAGLQYI